MPAPWEKKYGVQIDAAQPAEGTPWAHHYSTEGAEAQRPTNQVEYGNILPLRYDKDGTHFDIDGGITGAVKRAVSLPGEVMRGQVDPMSNEGIDRAIEMGMVITPTGVAARSGVGILGAPVKGKRVAPSTPTAVELKDASRAGYKALRETGAEYPGALVGEFAGRIRGQLEADGIVEELAPGAYAILKRLENPPEGSVATITQLQAARKGLSKVASNFGQNAAHDQAAAASIISKLDGFIEAVGKRSPMGGRGKASRLLDEANANYRAAKGSKDITGLEYGADLRAAAANSGQNIGNNIRGRVASVLTQPAKRSRYNPEEVAALEGVVNGSFMANKARDLGNRLGGGGGWGGTATSGVAAGLGHMLAGPAGALAGGVGTLATGVGARKLSNALTRKALHQADDLVRANSPLHRQAVENAPLEIPNHTSHEALVRALMLQKFGMQNRIRDDETTY